MWTQFRNFWREASRGLTWRRK